MCPVNTSTTLDHVRSRSQYQIIFETGIAGDSQFPAGQRDLSIRSALPALPAGSGIVFELASDEMIVVKRCTLESAGGVQTGSTGFQYNGKITVLATDQNKNFLGTAMGVVTALITLTAGAQSEGPVLEEIIVTATKRAETIQDVPIAVQAYNFQEIKDLEMKTATDVTRFLANVFAAGDGSTQPSYFIRGIGEANFHMNSVGAVAQYLDEVSLNTPLAAAFQIFDMDRIEVLRGPQNTLFGRNTTGGAIQHVSRKPSLDDGTNGYVQLTLGREGQADSDAAVGTNLSGRVAIRVAGSVHTRDGIYENTFTGRNEGEIERYAGRVQLVFAPSDTVEILANLHVGTNRGDNLRFKSIGTQDPVDPSLVCPIDPASWRVGTNCADGGGFIDSSDYLQVHQDMTTIADIDNLGGFFRVEWDLTNFTLTSLTAFEKNDMKRNEDSDSGPSFFFTFHQEGDVEQYTQEFRLTSAAESSFRWIAGLYYFTEDSFWNTTVRRSPPPAPPPGPYPPGAFTILPTTQVSQDNDTWSIYGQGDLDLSDRVTATVGLRFISETKDFVNTPLVGDGSQYDPNLFIGAAEAGANPLAVLPTLYLEETWNEWAGKLGLQFNLTDDAMIYGSISRGFKGGGFSVAALQALVGEAARSVKPEFLTTVELGAKTSWAKNRVQLNGAVFWNDWKDQQMFAVIPVGGELLPLLINVPESELIGAEVELRWIPAEGWLLMGALGLLDSEVTDPGNLSFVSTGNVLPNAADYSYNLQVRRDIELAKGSLSLQADYAYMDDLQYDIENKPELIQEGYGLLNARANYNFGEAERFQFSIWGKNLTDEKYCTAKSDLRGVADNITCVTNDALPLYGVSFTANF